MKQWYALYLYILRCWPCDIYIYKFKTHVFVSFDNGSYLLNSKMSSKAACIYHQYDLTERNLIKLMEITIFSFMEVLLIQPHLTLS